ncbi:MAG: class II fumarate hydratase [Bacteroidota bacterium]|nr:class II fumarate hydratase [Bacteroidota bacterium]
MREEYDSLGKVLVPETKLWGAQTQRSINNFKIGDPSSMPIEIIKAYAILKKAAAFANYELSVISKEKKELIEMACNMIEAGELDEHFPLVIWQTGSGTQTNMNLNEVISNVVKKNSGISIHPNDDVNKSQSSNDTFPTAMHIAAYKIIISHILPSLEKLKLSLIRKSKEFSDIVKIGRTHLMDATPLTLGQEFSCYASQIDFGIKAIKNSLNHMLILPIGGTAVGTGINAPKNFDKHVVEHINQFTSCSFIVSENKFEGIAAHDAFVESHSALKQVAISLNKIANDIRLLASGPRCGIGELKLKANEPGSSIMPGKVNPTQCEAVSMVCAQVFGNDSVIGFAASKGQFQLNVFKPVIAFNFIFSARILADACLSFTENCINTIEPDLDKINKNLNNSLMLITCLNEKLGYDNCAKIAKNAHEKNISLMESSSELGFLTNEEYKSLVDVKKMTNS